MYQTLIASLIFAPSLFSPSPMIPVEQAQDWANETIAVSTLPKSDNIKVTMADSPDNCGANASVTNLGGCTFTVGDQRLVVISPDLAGTTEGEHILFHEYAHALGFSNECMAEYVSRNYVHADLSYPECFAPVKLPNNIR